MLEIILPNKAQFDTMNMHLANISLPTATSITIADAGNIITATNVEGALQENRTLINTLDASIVAHKAEITQYAAVLINGFSGSIKYRKNKHGVVHLTIAIDGLTTNADNAEVCTLPIGYRPFGNAVIPVIRANNSPYTPALAFYIREDGKILVSKDSGLTIQASASAIMGEISYYGGIT